MAPSTFQPTNSSIREWFDFDYMTSPTLPGCTINGTEIGCSHVCNNRTSLFFAQTTNLVTCGIWTSLILASSIFDIKGTLLEKNESIIQHLDPFHKDVNLKANDSQSVSIYADTISSGFGAIYEIVRTASFADDGTIPSACTKGSIFPADIYWRDGYQSPVIDCVQEICSPLTLNPDLAGIGMFSSFLVQAALVFIAYTALFVMESQDLTTNVPHKSPKTIYADEVVVALIEYHKAQCYFAIVIQIPALVLCHMSSDLGFELFEDMLDTSIMIISAGSGLVPVALTLACITRYGRQSWYLLVLSWMAVILATVTLLTAYQIAHRTGGGDGIYDDKSGYTFAIDASPLTLNDSASRNLSEIVFPLCGNSNLLSNTLPPGLIDNWWTILIWINCVTWMLFCLWKKCFDTKYLSGFRQRMDKLVKKHHWIDFIITESRKFRAWIFLSILPWSLCFGWQFYLLYSYFKHNLISYEWSFGQIIAGFVWVPSVVEFIYILINGVTDASEYKYPSPLVLTRDIALSTIAMASLGAPPVSSDEELVCTQKVSQDEISVPEQKIEHVSIDEP